MTEHHAIGGTRQLCTFMVSDLLFGLEVERIQEVLRYHDMTPVPLAPALISGLINLRGQIVTAIDLRTRLALAPRPVEALPMNVVLTPDHGSVSLLVDEIGDVLDLDPAHFERTPQTIDAGLRSLTRGVYKLDSRLLLVLDANRTIAVDPADESERSTERRTPSHGQGGSHDPHPERADHQR